MSTSLDLFRVIVPRMATVADATVEVHLTRAATRHTAAPWGAMYAEAMVLYAAHLIAKTPGLFTAGDASGVSGPVTSRRAGDLAESYAAPREGTTAEEHWLATTPEGREYLSIRATRGAAYPRFVSGAVT